ncbi:MAG: hypothetical protein AB4372_34560 [Xenococcus sp. (in: cyanobacteria)]
MKRTLYIPDELWEQLNNYLQEHPQENFSSVVQTALKNKLSNGFQNIIVLRHCSLTY